MLFMHVYISQILKRENFFITIEHLKSFNYQNEWSYLPTPPLGQDMTQGQFITGV